MIEAPSRENVSSVVVTFQPPEPEVFNLLQVLGSIASSLVVVDNGSDPPVVARLRAAAEDRNFGFIANRNNVGIARALNQGVCWARDRGAAWVLLSDQDSEFAPHVLSAMATCFAEFGDKGRVAVIGANYGGPDEPLGRYPSRGYASQYSCQRAVITSGSLISLAAFDAIGPFDEQLFIDHVDHDYCMRARQRSFAVLATREVLVRHRIGNESKHPCLGRYVIASNHPPVRRYYKARNALVVARRYFVFDPGWVVAMLYESLRDLLAMLVFEENRRVKLCYSVYGLWHGFRNKMGPICIGDQLQERRAG